MNSIVNPILPGFHPDPSILRVGDDYYIATSTFRMVSRCADQSFERFEELEIVNVSTDENLSAEYVWKH